MKTYTKEKVNEGEVLIYEEVLNTIADKYNPKFSRLVLPEAISTSTSSARIILPLYEGELFNDKWTEATGGSLLKLDLSEVVPAILKDLSMIDINPIIENPRLSKIPRLVFNHTEYLNDLHSHLEKFSSAGLISKQEVKTAREIIKQPFTSHLIFNNGDFYPRNFIRTPEGKIVLIDWDTWSEDSRANTIDHPENVAAYCFVHMWSNREWQEKYIQELRKQFGFKRNNFQISLIIKSLEMANFWFVRGLSDLLDHQIKLFKGALSKDYMDSLWSL